jgi:two-component system nitrate/nitrite response regulator NarL
MQHILLVAAIADEDFLRSLHSEVARQDDMHIVGAIQDPERMLRTIDNLRPDVLLLDEALATPYVLGRIREASAGTRTILVSNHCDEHCGAGALRRGARGCISCDLPISDCLRVIRAVNRGEVWVGRKQMATVLDDLLMAAQRRSEESVAQPGRLSQRESQIVEAIRLGLTNKEIARKLNISDTTVKTHLERIFHKLKVSRRVQVAIVSRLPRRLASARTRAGDVDAAASAKSG